MNEDELYIIAGESSVYISSCQIALILSPRTQQSFAAMLPRWTAVWGRMSEHGICNVHTFLKHRISWSDLGKGKRVRIKDLPKPKPPFFFPFVRAVPRFMRVRSCDGIFEFLILLLLGLEIRGVNVVLFGIWTSYEFQSLAFSLPILPSVFFTWIRFALINHHYF